MLKFSKFYFSLLNTFRIAISKRQLVLIYKGPIKKYTYNILACLIKAGLLSRIQYFSNAKYLKVYFNYNKFSYPAFRQLKFISTNTLNITVTVKQLIFLHQRYPSEIFIIYTRTLGFIPHWEAIDKGVSGILVLKIIH